MTDSPNSNPRGLTAAEAAQRLAHAGFNELTTRGRGAHLEHLLHVAFNPLVVILLAAAVITALVGNPVQAAIIVVMVSLSLVLTTVQTFRSEQAVERLKREVAPSATAMRDGAWIEVPRREIVPGDLVRLVAGDLVPADGRLIEARDLHVQEAALTGESMPVEKTTSNPVFLGTSVVSGTATMGVDTTGLSTRFGDIAKNLAARPPETEFERGIRQFGFLIVRIVMLLVLFVFLVSALLHHDPFESLLFAVALAVGLVPEFLPVITTVTLAQGAVHMAREKVIVKNLAAIQHFGSIDILCSDKTGTLTTGVMALDQYVDPQGTKSERTFLFAYLNSVCETGIPHPINAALLAESTASATPAKPPLDTAILQHHPVDVAAFQKLDEMPFDFERRRVSVVVASTERGARWLITKGAPEGVLAVCTAVEHDGVAGPLTEQERAACERLYQGFSANGYRVLAVAMRDVDTRPAYTVADEHAMTLVGFVAFADPIREDTVETLSALKRDGVEIKIITGDNELVTRHVCTQAGVDAGTIVLGDALDAMSDSALGQVAEATAVFARVSPGQKNRIILALKSRGHVVGYLGDGINDAPSLHAADVGISVANAADVAREAADVILLERSLRVLHSGIIEGRKAFGNMMKYLLMGTSSNFGNMFSMAGASVFLPFLPMLPTQILLNNFLYDVAQVTIPSDNVDPTFIVKPRRWDVGLIRRFMIVIGPISSIYDFLTFFVLLKMFGAGEALFHTGWFVESLATQTLVVFVIRTAGNPFTSRPSGPLTASVLSIVLIGTVLPFTGLAPVFGFTPLPPAFFLFLVAATLTYLALVEVVKRRLMRGMLG